jgi:hypothetical protein
MESIVHIRWTDRCTSIIIREEIITSVNHPDDHHHEKRSTMELIALLAAVVAVNAIARRWGVDSRDGRDWCEPS